MGLGALGLGLGLGVAVEARLDDPLQQQLAQRALLVPRLAQVRLGLGHTLGAARLVRVTVRIRGRVRVRVSPDPNPNARR